MNSKKFTLFMVAIFFIGVASIYQIFARYEEVPAKTPRKKLSPPLRKFPKNGIRVKPGDDLQKVIDGAEPGSNIILSPGRYKGPLLIEKSIKLFGTKQSVISNFSGTTVKVVADNVLLYGFSVEGSGQRFDKLDAAVYFRGKNLTAQNLTLSKMLFGFVVERGKKISLIGNTIIGDPKTQIGLRGDGIHIWASSDSRIEYNTLTDGRDIVIWYSPKNLLRYNKVYRSRYGTHFMYSSFSQIISNYYRENSVGIFLMYSNDVTVKKNFFADQRGVSGYGIGIKESGNIEIKENVIFNNKIGLYLDYSPFKLGQKNQISNTLFTYNDTAIVFQKSEKNNLFADNNFIYNSRQVFVEGRGDTKEILWKNNYFDDYRGYDLDRDGFGDIPYQIFLYSDSLIEDLPTLQFFRSTPAWTILEIFSRLFPLYSPRLILTDPKPRYSPTEIPKLPNF